MSRYNSVNRWKYKAVYIRETIDGKSRWIKIPGLGVRNGNREVSVSLSNQYEEDTGVYARMSRYFRKEGRAE